MADRNQNAGGDGYGEEGRGSLQSRVSTKNYKLQATPPENSQPTQQAQHNTIKRKDVPMAGDTRTSADLPQDNRRLHPQYTPNDNATNTGSPERETDLPIASEFTIPPVDTRSSLDAARQILNQQSSEGQTDPGTRDIVSDDLLRDIERLDFNSSDVVSPASFVSANENYFERDRDTPSKHLPSAEEIVERAKYNSVDATYHNKMAPAVTHETIRKQVHEITEKHITRDIHHYHHVHRILPVHEVEVLPAKHYRIVDGAQVEMKPEEVPQSRIDAWESAIIPKVEGR